MPITKQISPSIFDGLLDSQAGQLSKHAISGFLEAVHHSSLTLIKSGPVKIKSCVCWMPPRDGAWLPNSQGVKCKVPDQ